MLLEECQTCKKKASLACVECGSRNYSITLGASARTVRLEMNKHCKYCKKHTKHRETK
ncbi:50S ribosomal protein L33 [Brochothrix campestris]|uniref:50S ribosomal protein L33 n=1 Tax=Brochothrix campestris TaxID=2757 RepID=UPI001E2AE7C0|nr:50S ribosomal protein L33 [Brochothrix campestris]